VQSVREVRNGSIAGLVVAPPLHLTFSPLRRSRACHAPTSVQWHSTTELLPANNKPRSYSLLPVLLFDCAPLRNVVLVGGHARRHSPKLTPTSSSLPQPIFRTATADRLPSPHGPDVLPPTATASPQYPIATVRSRRRLLSHLPLLSRIIVRVAFPTKQTIAVEPVGSTPGQTHFKMQKIRGVGPSSGYPNRPSFA
jgi:hypothetical protein